MIMKILKINVIYFTYSIRRGLRALGDREFPMPSNIIGIAKTRRELIADVVDIVPPWKKIQKIK